jgi:hypothetical protein
MKTLLLSLAYTIGIGELILAGYFWVTNSKNEIRRVMALLAFSTGMWVITSALSSYTSQSPTTIFILKSIYVFGVFLVTSLVHLSIIFPISIVRFDKLHAFLLYIPALIWSCIAMTSNSIVLNYVGTTDSPGLVVSGTLHHTYNYYLLFLFFATLSLFFIKIRRHASLSKNIYLVFYSIAIGGALPVFYDLIIPNFFPGLYNSTNYLVANLSTVVWLGVTSYIVLKK